MFVYAENDTTNPDTQMNIEIDDVSVVSSISGKGYVAGDLVWFYELSGSVDNALSVPTGATKLFAIPMIGAAVLQPIIPQGGSTQFTVLGRNVKYQNPPMLSMTGLVADIPLKKYHASLDLKPWAPAGAVEVQFNDDVEIHSSAAGSIIGGSVLSTPIGALKNVSLYPSGPSHWDAQDVSVTARLRRYNQMMTAHFDASAGQIDGIYEYVFVEGYVI